MIITLLDKKFTSPMAWEAYKENEKLPEGEIVIKLHLVVRGVFFFSVRAGNITVCDRNPFYAIFQVLEHESVGAIKYERLKAHLRNKKMWQKI